MQSVCSVQLQAHYWWQIFDANENEKNISANDCLLQESIPVEMKTRNMQRCKLQKSEILTSLPIKKTKTKDASVGKRMVLLVQ